MARGDDEWAVAALRPIAFDSKLSKDAHETNCEVLTRESFREVAYASTRMLHAWRVPATVGGKPYVDASYTDGFPIRALARFNLHTLLAVATGIGEQFTN